MSTAQAAANAEVVLALAAEHPHPGRDTALLHTGMVRLALAESPPVLGTHSLGMGTSTPGIRTVDTRRELRRMEALGVLQVAFQEPFLEAEGELVVALPCPEVPRPLRVVRQEWARRALASCVSQRAVADAQAA